MYVEVKNAVEIKLKSLSCESNCSEDKIDWKYLLKNYNNKTKRKINIMVAHIKTHRLVAFLIYSSLSIYASHGKKEYIIQISIREISLKLLFLCIWYDVVVVVVRATEWVEEERRKKIMLSGFMLPFIKECFCAYL